MVEMWVEGGQWKGAAITAETICKPPTSSQQLATSICFISETPAIAAFLVRARLQTIYFLRLIDAIHCHTPVGKDSFHVLNRCFFRQFDAMKIWSILVQRVYLT